MVLGSGGSVLFVGVMARTNDVVLTAAHCVDRRCRELAVYSRRFFGGAAGKAAATPPGFCSKFGE